MEVYNGKIYIIKNTINKKVYIGQTIRSVKQRFKEHLKESNYVKGCLYNSMKKHGRENFYVELLEKDIYSIKELNDREAYNIKKYNAYTEGYNATFGGAIVSDNGIPVIQLNKKNGEFIQRFESAAEAGRRTKQSKSNILKCLKGLYQTAGGYIWVREHEYKDFIFEKPTNKLKVVVLQLNKETGNVIKRFETLSSAAKELGISKGNISTVCNGGLKSAGGYGWKIERSVNRSE